MDDDFERGPVPVNPPELGRQKRKDRTCLCARSRRWENFRRPQCGAGGGVEKGDIVLFVP
jgi:hypothetical protein